MKLISDRDRQLGKSSGVARSDGQAWPEGPEEDAADAARQPEAVTTQRALHS